MDWGEGFRTLAKKDNGECSQLGEDGKCSIYEHRPRACRIFDCRVSFLLSRRETDPIMQEAMSEWGPLKIATVEDRKIMQTHDTTETI
jgi:Fe-S-cluster containining protein